MEKGIIEKVSEYYSQKIRRYGAVPRGVDWNDEASQRLRFEKLSCNFPEDREFTVGELGCGYGAFFDYCKEKFPLIRRYTGYDCSPDMIEKAKMAIADERAGFELSSVIKQKADYTAVSGAFHVKLDFSDNEWKEYIIANLNNLHEMSVRGFSFNCMSSYVDYKEPHLYYADPKWFFDHCKRNYSSYVTLIHDYPLYEWTMIIAKP